MKSKTGEFKEDTRSTHEKLLDVEKKGKEVWSRYNKEDSFLDKLFD